MSVDIKKANALPAVERYLCSCDVVPRLMHAFFILNTSQPAEAVSRMLSSLAAAEYHVSGSDGSPGASPSAALAVAVRMAAEEDGMIGVTEFRNIAAASALLAGP